MKKLHADPRGAMRETIRADALRFKMRINHLIIPLLRVIRFVRSYQFVPTRSGGMDDFMGRLFGTDGVRGVANRDLDVELAMKIGRAAAMVLGEGTKFVIGKDTRISSDMLESALIAGLCSTGAHVISLGVVPTPAVAYLVKHYEADAGIMISASHNPFEYNGIKIFNADGYKLSDEKEHEIEAILLDHAQEFACKEGAHLGKILHVDSPVGEYIEHLKTATHVNFSGLRVLIDCANGSAAVTAKELFSDLGAACTFVHCAPNGVNINDHCGSTHIQNLSEMVVKEKYDLAIAFDGDADRCLALDHEGNLVDGDQMMAIFALYLKEMGQLKDNCVVATVMSNLGFYKFAKKFGVKTQATKVGDRYVLENMLEHGYNLGGEQSGHMIFLDYMTTGDGQLSAIQLLKIMKSTGKSLKELASVMEVYPQTLKNIHATPKMKREFLSDKEVMKVIEQLEKSLDGNGRILVRASGTEPLIRVMVEGESIAKIQEIADEIATVIVKRLG